MRLEGWNLDQAIDRAFDDRSYDAGRPVIHAMLCHDPWTLYDPLYSEFVFTPNTRSWWRNRRAGSMAGNTAVTVAHRRCRPEIDKR